MSRQTWPQLARNRAFIAWSAGATVFAVAVSLVPQLGAVLGVAPLATPVTLLTAALALVTPALVVRLAAE
jgi:hypothetical protein